MADTYALWLGEAGNRVISPKARKLAAIATGLTLAGVSAWATSYAFDRYIERQATRDLDVTARRVLTLAELRLNMVQEALDDLAGRNVHSCTGSDLAAMQEVAFRTVPIKELSVVELAGDTRCTNLAISLGERAVIAPIATPRSGFTIDIVRVGQLKDSYVRLRRATDAGTSVAALMPTDLMLPRTASDGGPRAIQAALTTSDGTVFGERAADNGGHNHDGEMLTANVRSTTFGIAVTTRIPHTPLLAGQRDVAIAAAVGAGGATLVLILLAFGLTRPSHEPIAELARAIRNNEFVPYYQPIIDLNDARMVSAEVLVRWRKPDGSLVPPAQFIPLAESSGLIIELTRVLMRRVCAEAGAEIGARPRFRVGFNLSARHFLDESVVDDVREIFTASPIALDQVLLEVTERQALTNLTVARRVIAALQGLGAHVGIDDLGTGHSGLSYMMKLGVDFIKLDKMFVDALETERYSTTIIETLVSLARDMRMDIIAEGVETFEQVQHLRERGIRKAQGYVFAPPLPGPSFLKLLAASDAAPAPKSIPLAVETIPVKKVA